MYDWRRMTPAEREEILAIRRTRGFPKHNPPHLDVGDHYYHFTAACYEHQPLIACTAQRIIEFEIRLLEVFRIHCSDVFAWCILPNHYHCLARTEDLGALGKGLGRLRGRLSHEWNGEDGARGHKVWHRGADRAIRSERHFWATVNYIHHNPVRHRYVQRWQAWPFSSAGEFLERVGREEARRIWEAYPVLDYGKDWDNPEM